MIFCQHLEFTSDRYVGVEVYDATLGVHCLHMCIAHLYLVLLLVDVDVCVTISVRLRLVAAGTTYSIHTVIFITVFCRPADKGLKNEHSIISATRCRSGGWARAGPEVPGQKCSHLHTRRKYS